MNVEPVGECWFLSEYSAEIKRELILNRETIEKLNKTEMCLYFFFVCDLFPVNKSEQICMTLFEWNGDNA